MAKAIPNPGLLHAENPLRQQLTTPEGAPADQRGQTNWSALVLGDSYTPSANPGDSSYSAEDVNILFAQNSHLRNAISDLERRIEQASPESQQSWLDRQREYEVLLEEKS